MCEACKREMIDLLEARIRRILQVSRDEGTEADQGIAEAECFHLMEICEILSGKPTSGVYDDYGLPPTITGPLFRQAEAR